MSDVVLEGIVTGEPEYSESRIKIPFERTQWYYPFNKDLEDPDRVREAKQIVNEISLIEMRIVKDFKTGITEGDRIVVYSDYNIIEGKLSLNTAGIDVLEKSTPPTNRNVLARYYAPPGCRLES